MLGSIKAFIHATARQVPSKSWKHYMMPNGMNG